MKSITYILRRPQILGNFSLELHFNEIVQHVSKEINVRVVTLPFVSKGILRKILNLIFVFFKRGKVNHITGDATYVAIALVGTTTVLTILDCVLLQHSNKIKYFIYKALWFKMPMLLSTSVTTISDSIRIELVELFPEYAHKIETIYFTGNNHFRKSPKVFNENKPLILQIGTAKNKNVINTLLALKEFRCEFIIVGVHLPEVERYSTDYISVRQINRPLSNDEMFELYKQADIISFSSTYEGFGMPIVEANTIGRVVVTSDRGAMKEVAGDAAIFVDPFSQDSIRRGFELAHTEHSLRKELIERGYRNTERFSASLAASRYMRLY